MQCTAVDISLEHGKGARKDFPTHFTMPTEYSEWSDDSGDERAQSARQFFDLHKLTSRLVPEYILEITGIRKEESRRLQALRTWSEVMVLCRLSKTITQLIIITAPWLRAQIRLGCRTACPDLLRNCRRPAGCMPVSRRPGCYRRRRTSGAGNFADVALFTLAARSRPLTFHQRCQF